MVLFSLLNWPFLYLDIEEKKENFSRSGSSYGHAWHFNLASSNELQRCSSFYYSVQVYL